MKPSPFTLLPTLALCLSLAAAQQQPSVFTHADTLRGMMSPERTCYDITYYHLDIKVDTASRSVSGSNRIVFRAVSDFDRMQVDLFENMKIDRIEADDGKILSFTRDGNAFFISFPQKLKQGTTRSVTIHYSGTPQVAANPPWSGGFTWTKDKEGNPWIVVTCQETGASLWWPNKDHQSDEPDSMLLSVTVPVGLTNVSNGRLRATTELPGGWTRFDWFISYPINSYNVTINIGKFVHFGEVFEGAEKLTLDYYVKPYNLEKAKEQFKQVKPMMECYEKHFGPYPFPRDGYKLVESPHLGMEHQSAVAYGNNYVQGYRGTGSSEAGVKFDFIIIHETAHEWWGNSVTSRDIADMWIHESFGAYAEAVYVECLFGYEEAMKYVNGKKPNVQNRAPIIGTYNVHKRGAGDMYDKGQLVLNTLRHVIDNDNLWWEIIKGLAVDFRHSIVTAEDLFATINKKTGRDYGYFFEQYLKKTKIPVLELMLTKSGDDVTLRYRWAADVEGFAMPVKVTTAKGEYSFINPTTSSQTLNLNGLSPDDFRVATDLFYVDVRLRTLYLDPKRAMQ
ncbi:MAG: M1 family metallopeptidase [Ignavibacteriales bacterium]|nr:M1 family metallopeptidase [Ignavibacteriales bacterium]